MPSDPVRPLRAPRPEPRDRPLAMISPRALLLTSALLLSTACGDAPAEPGQVAPALDLFETGGCQELADLRGLVMTVFHPQPATRDQAGRGLLDQSPDQRQAMLTNLDILKASMEAVKEMMV